MRQKSYSEVLPQNAGEGPLSRTEFWGSTMGHMEPISGMIMIGHMNFKAFILNLLALLPLVIIRTFPVDYFMIFDNSCKSKN